MEATGDFHDWEMLHRSDANPGTGPNSPGTWSGFDRIGSDSGGVIRSDYFAINLEKKALEVDREAAFMVSSKSVSADPCLETGDEDDPEKDVGFAGVEVSLGKPDFSLAGLDSWKFRDFEREIDLGHVDDEKREMGFGGTEVSSGKSLKFEENRGVEEIEGTELEPKNSGEFWSDMSSDDGMDFGKGSGFDGKVEMDCEGEVGFERIANESSDTNKLLLDSGGDRLIAGDLGGPEGEGGLCDTDFPKTGDGSLSSMEAEGVVVSDSSEIAVRDGGELLGDKNASDGEVKSGGGEKKATVWWKLPSELLKFCVFRVGPVWSISIAAAIIGIVILRRRLYRMRRKSRSIPINVSVDEKVMVRVARLNEAFSVVRRIPIMWSSVPAARGVTPWPVMSLR